MERQQKKKLNERNNENFSDRSVLTAHTHTHKMHWNMKYWQYATLGYAFDHSSAISLFLFHHFLLRFSVSFDPLNNLRRRRLNHAFEWYLSFGFTVFDKLDKRRRNFLHFVWLFWCYWFQLCTYAITWITSFASVNFHIKIETPRQYFIMHSR